jgi:hypothetical protein
MDRTACTEPQCLYKGAFYLYLQMHFYDWGWNLREVLQFSSVLFTISDVPGALQSLWLSVSVMSYTRFKVIVLPTFRYTCWQSSLNFCPDTGYPVMFCNSPPRAPPPPRPPPSNFPIVLLYATTAPFHTPYCSSPSCHQHWQLFASISLKRKIDLGHITSKSGR